MRAGRVEPALAPQHLARADADPDAPRDLGRDVARRVLARHRVAREDDPVPVPRHAHGDQEVVHRGRVFRQRPDQPAPRRVDPAVGAEADSQGAFGLLHPGLAIPEFRLGRLARAGAPFEHQPAARRADARVAEGAREGRDRSRLEARVGVGEDDEVCRRVAHEVVRRPRPFRAGSRNSTTRTRPAPASRASAAVRSRHPSQPIATERSGTPAWPSRFATRAAMTDSSSAAASTTSTERGGAGSAGSDARDRRRPAAR